MTAGRGAGGGVGAQVAGAEQPAGDACHALSSGPSRRQGGRHGSPGPGGAARFALQILFRKYYKNVKNAFGKVGVRDAFVHIFRIYTQYI